jgi:hypothetical protein
MKVINSFWPAGDGSTLDLDFTQMSTLADLTSRGFTFSRSTSGTFINANGLVATATAGNPRFEYDPNGNPRGILIEGSATNLVYHSETFRLTAVAAEPFWADSASLSRGNDTAPDGTANAAVNFVATGTPGTVIQTAAVGSIANRTFSFWAKRTGGGSVEYTLDNGSTWTSVTITANWVRYTATATNANQRVGFRIATGAGTSIWGAQLEAGSGSSSYIPSGASQGSRSFDYCEMGNIAALNYSTTNGSMLYEGQFSQFRATSFATMRTAFCTASGAVEAFGAFAYGSTMYPTAQDTTGNTALATITPAMTINTNFRAAWSLNASLVSGEVRGCINGGSVAASGTTTMSATATPTILTIGGRPSYGAHYPCGTIKRVKYWPTTLSDATLQSITT